MDRVSLKINRVCIGYQKMLFLPQNKNKSYPKFWIALILIYFNLIAYFLKSKWAPCGAVVTCWSC